MTEPSPAVRAALDEFHKGLATRKTPRFIIMESTNAHVPLDRLPLSPGVLRDMAVARSDRPEADLESASERRPLIFRGILIASAVGLLLWWVIGGVVR